MLIAFIGTPIAEIAVFIEAGSRFGLWPTVGAVILTAVIGTALLRAQGLAVLRRAQQTLNRGEMPLVEVFDGLCLVGAGALLLTPGFITDAIGFALLLPPVRALLRIWTATRLAAHVHTVHMHTPPGHGPGAPDGNGVIIDGDYSEAHEKQPDNEPPTLDHKPDSKP